MPINFTQIVPLLAWGSRSAHFNYSIWHVALLGVTEAAHVGRAIESYKALQAKEAVRLCLKYFRQRNYTESFDHLQKRTKVDLESPVLTELYKGLVSKGDFGSAEDIIVASLTEDVLQEYISKFRCHGLRDNFDPPFMARFHQRRHHRTVVAWSNSRSKSRCSMRLC